MKRQARRASAKDESLVQKGLAYLMAIVLALAAIYGTCWLAWKAVLQIEANAARAAMLIELVFLPLVAYGAWCCGRLEAKGRLQGIDQSVDKLMEGLTKATTLKVGAARAMRAPTVATTTAEGDIELPEPEVFYLPSGGKMIEL